MSDSLRHFEIDLCAHVQDRQALLQRLTLAIALAPPRQIHYRPRGEVKTPTVKNDR